MSIRCRNPFALIVLAAAAPPSIAGPDWTETAPGAGSLPPDAQPVMASPVSTISGELKGPAPFRGVDPPDFEDMYLIYINHPATFSARTDGLDAAQQSFAEFDSQLWLFSLDGRGVLGNDTSSEGGTVQTGSLIRFPATDGTGPTMPQPGFYYLAISGVANVPVSPGGPIFNIADPTEISGPDGPGGSIPISGWSGPGGFGMYRIALTGVVPTPGAAAMLSIAVAGAAGRRRR